MDIAWVHWSSFWVGVLCAYAVLWLAFAGVTGLCWIVRDWLTAQRKRARVRRGIRVWARETFGDGAAALMAPGASIADVERALAAHQAQRDREAAEDLIRSLSRRT
jgi:hypothetical protein